MATWTALTHTAGREAAEALAELGEDLVPEPVGSGIFEIEDGKVRTRREYYDWGMYERQIAD